MAQENDPDEQERRKREEERRRRRERQRKDEERNDRTDDALEVVDAGAAAGSGCARVAGCGRGRGSGRGDADGGCDGPCDFTLMRLSALLLVAAVLVPDRPVARRVVRGLVQGYRRWLTRFTPACPSTPSCSAYALSAVDTMGVRRGLVAAADRIRRCGTG